MELESVGEFGLIDLIGDGVFAPEHIIRGIGDDCAVLPYSETNYQLVSCDMLNETIHFLLDKITPYQLGYKSVAVSLSDIAAMGGTPTNVVIAIGLTASLTVEWWQEFYRGVADVCQRYHVNIAGGDTTKSAGGLSINVTVLGLVAKEHLRLRSAAQAGDKIFVTGPLGASRAGLELLLHPEKSSAGYERLLKEHLQPEPCCQEAAWLNEACGSALHALNDISDGLVSECTEISKASHAVARSYSHIGRNPAAGRSVSDRRSALGLVRRRGLSAGRHFGSAGSRAGSRALPKACWQTALFHR